MNTLPLLIGVIALGLIRDYDYKQIIKLESKIKELEKRLNEYTSIKN